MYESDSPFWGFSGLVRVFPGCFGKSDIWIKNIPSGLVMTGFDFQVVWDKDVIDLVCHNFPAPDNWDTYIEQETSEGNYRCQADGGWAPVSANKIWVTLEFQCPAKGSTTIHALDVGHCVSHASGQVFSANKVLVLAPYLIGIFSIVAVAVLVKWRKS